MDGLKKVNVVYANKTCFVDWDKEYLKGLYEHSVSNKYKVVGNEVKVIDKDSVINDEDGCPLEKGCIRIISNDKEESKKSIKELNRFVDWDADAMYKPDEHDVLDFIAVENKNRDKIYYKSIAVADMDMNSIADMFRHKFKGKKLDRIMMLFHGIDDININEVINKISYYTTEEILFRGIDMSGKPEVSIWYSEKIR